MNSFKRNIHTKFVFIKFLRLLTQIIVMIDCRKICTATGAIVTATANRFFHKYTLTASFAHTLPRLEWVMSFWGEKVFSIE